MTSFVDRYGPVAVVAGASEGLGAAFAETLAARGLHLVLLARRAELLAELAAKITAAHGVTVQVIAVDLANAGVGLSADLERGGRGLRGGQGGF